ncbi:efflux RND transporter periplasmic adaptor subunit [Paucibacter sp. DJ2R-2]|uniref:efflux RND transporter periplasmic adaptor subunit n=1 Tax=Paucibacter sp. DJ2R-2 TaxID=2893558 RepID=UPI0021E3D9C3|nr:efflux RND transporter periplasmic adaptor subunit [Paucibacter sp. DJ2R-2]MCV2421982.1 efflux RND transporter periplasmic adaptor subunit [Paucibacter sp. DJ4R-1]MCV2439401.1 efflux RND transporter periplasmic adaptor subunit [Paucibacter sp. DJ2R-2]
MNLPHAFMTLRAAAAAVMPVRALLRQGTAGLLLLSAAATAAPAASTASAPNLQSLVVQASGATRRQSVDGVVEAQRQTVLAAQVAGAIVEIAVRPGDRVRAGQMLMRLDARAAEQAASASEAQGQAARAGLQLAQRELERQQQLFKQHYISQAALDQALNQYQATRAQLDAQLAQLGVARTQSGQHLLRSPYDAVVAEIPVSLGDMAMPGRPLLTVYDPKALRVTAHVPQSQAGAQTTEGLIEIEIPGQTARLLPLRRQWMPTVDAATHSQELRLDLPQTSARTETEVAAGTAAQPALSPGMFARVWLDDASPAPAAQAGRPLLIPRSAVLRRAELNLVYVIVPQTGQALLRQLRLGAKRGDQVEVLSGLSAGERIATEPAVAARQPVPPLAQGGQKQ